MHSNKIGESPVNSNSVLLSTYTAPKTAISLNHLQSTLTENSTETEGGYSFFGSIGSFFSRIWSSITSFLYSIFCCGMCRSSTNTSEETPDKTKNGKSGAEVNKDESIDYETLSREEAEEKALQLKAQLALLQPRASSSKPNTLNKQPKLQIIADPTPEPKPRSVFEIHEELKIRSTPSSGRSTLSSAPPGFQSQSLSSDPRMSTGSLNGSLIDLDDIPDNTPALVQQPKKSMITGTMNKALQDLKNLNFDDDDISTLTDEELNLDSLKELITSPKGSLRKDPNRKKQEQTDKRKSVARGGLPPLPPVANKENRKTMQLSPGQVPPPPNNLPPPIPTAPSPTINSNLNPIEEIKQNTASRRQKIDSYKTARTKDTQGVKDQLKEDGPFVVNNEKVTDEQIDEWGAELRDVTYTQSTSSKDTVRGNVKSFQAKLRKQYASEDDKKKELQQKRFENFSVSEPVKRKNNQQP